MQFKPLSLDLRVFQEVDVDFVAGQGIVIVNISKFFLESTLLALRIKLFSSCRSAQLFFSTAVTAVAYKKFPFLTQPIPPAIHDKSFLMPLFFKFTFSVERFKFVCLFLISIYYNRNKHAEHEEYKPSGQRNHN